MSNARRTSKVNPQRVELARKSRLLSQTQLASSLGIDQGRLSRIERGESSVNEDLLNSLANILDYPGSFFYEEGDTLGLPISLHESGSFRKRQSLNKRILESVEAIIGIYMACLKKLSENIEIEPDKTIRPVDLDEFNGDIEYIAEQLRHQWGLPSGPVRNLTVSIENAGCLIVKHDFGTEKIDGFSIWPKGFRPVIFIRKGMSGDRERFTLAHELGHLLLHTIRLSPDKEVEANRFASSFLMPKHDIKPFLPGLNLYRLQALKEEWKVSMAALAYRANELGVINPNQYRYLCMELSKHGYRKKEPIVIAPENPINVADMIKAHFEELDYTEEELCGLLSLNLKDFKKYFTFQNLFIRAA